MLCRRFTIHNTLSNVCCVGSIRCCAGGLPYTTHFQMYVVLEVLDVVPAVYHTQHTFNIMLCVSHFSTIVETGPQIGPHLH